MYRRIERFVRALDAPSLDLIGPFEIGEAYVSTGKRPRVRLPVALAWPVHARAWFVQRRQTPVLILADRGTGHQYVIPAKAADESTIRLLLASRQQESLTVYTDGFRAYESLEDDDAFSRKYVVHGDGEYAATRCTSIPARATRR